MFRRKNKEELKQQVAFVNEKLKKSHKRQFRPDEQDFNSKETNLKQIHKEDFRQYKKELKKIILIKKEFTRQLKENIDFDLSFFKNLKKDQPKLFKYLADSDAYKNIINNAFIRASKYCFFEHAEELKNLFDIPDKIYKSSEYIEAMKKSFFSGMNSRSFNTTSQLILSNNFPHEIFKEPKIQSELKSYKSAFENEMATDGLKILEIMEKKTIK